MVILGQILLRVGVAVAIERAEGPSQREVDLHIEAPEEEAFTRRDNVRRAWARLIL
jgi:hypothetical protein